MHVIVFSRTSSTAKTTRRTPSPTTRAGPSDTVAEWAALFDLLGFDVVAHGPAILMVWRRSGTRWPLGACRVSICASRLCFLTMLRVSDHRAESLLFLRASVLHEGVCSTIFKTRIQQDSA